MSKKSTSIVPVTTKIKDTAPELDDVRSIVLENRETPTPYDLTLVEGMASHMLTPDEICAVIRVPKGRFDKHLEYQAAYQRGQELGKASIRRMQFMTAKTQYPMQIWLGKQYLGQADRVDAPKGESLADAYQGFLNKLNIVINVPATGHAAPKTIGAGKGDCEVLLETVGTNRATSADTPAVVGRGENGEADRAVAGNPPKRNLHRLMEDMVVSGGTGQREDQSRSGVGP
jgi:hypothetical protein